MTTTLGRFKVRENARVLLFLFLSTNLQLNSTQRLDCTQPLRAWSHLQRVWPRSAVIADTAAVVFFLHGTNKRLQSAKQL